MPLRDAPLGKSKRPLFTKYRILPLKNLTVGYTLPADLTRKARIDRVRVYFSGDNLATWTALKSKYIDPEQFSTDGSARVYPFAKTFSFGLDITF